ncbi:PIR protein [Plasmodium vivax]|uniref:VIR protein n=1 Tax=Plasmodium vivax TaxID=5855 RepID=A0A565A4A2_PLAVI|nr:PIR protein [Plasmodium vivax]
MTTSDKDFSADKIKQEYKSIGNSSFYKIYDEFSRDCKKYDGDSAGSCYNGDLDSDVTDTKVAELVKELYINLYRIYYTMETQSNDYFEENQNEVKKMGYIYIKYWLYDQIFNKNFNDTQIEKVFEGWKKYIDKKIIYEPVNPYIFYNLKKDEIKKLRKIYAFSTFLYENIKYFETENNINSKYLDYFGEGLDEFISSMNRCPSEVSRGDYCREFDEFVNICKDNSSIAGISIYPENEGYSNEDIRKYLLTVEKRENKSLYIYINDKKMLNFLKTSDFLSNKNSTIAATSVVGSAIGLSSIFYYFYKFTPFGSTLLKGKRKNIVNIDKQAHNSLLYTSDTEQIPFENREYKVAYHTFNDT